MPVTLTIDREQRVVYSGFLGVISEDDFLGQGGKIRAHPLFDPSFTDMVDFSSTTEINVPDEALRVMAERKSIFDVEAIHIVIAPKGLLSRIAKLYQELTLDSRPNLVVVETRARAYEYLRERGRRREDRVDDGIGHGSM